MPRRPRPEFPDSSPPDCPEFAEPPYYHFVRTARTLAHRIMRRAVLRPILGRMDFRDHGLVLSAYLPRVRRRWIELATGYSDPYLPANPLVRERIQGLLDCRPPFAYVMPGGYRPCNTPSLCPSCWAREAAEAWSGLDRGLYGDAPARGARLAGVTLVVRKVGYSLWRVPVRPDGELVDPDAYMPLGPFLDRRIARPGRSFYAWEDVPGGSGPMPRRPSEFQRLARRGAACGLELTRIGTRVAYGPELAASCREHGVPYRDWGVIFTTILLVPTGSVVRVVRPPFGEAPGVAAGRASVPPGRVEVAAFADPTRRRLADAVAWASRYPARTILSGDRATLIEYLEARSGRRLRASFGDPAGLRNPPGRGVATAKGDAGSIMHPIGFPSHQSGGAVPAESGRQRLTDPAPRSTAARRPITAARSTSPP